MNTEIPRYQMILRPIPLTNRKAIQQEKVIQEQWFVLWEGKHRERPPSNPLPPLTK